LTAEKLFFGATPVYEEKVRFCTGRNGLAFAEGANPSVRPTAARPRTAGLLNDIRTSFLPIIISGDD
jgi:hypothetical protein